MTEDIAKAALEVAISIVGAFSPIAAAILRNGAAIAWAAYDHEKSGNVEAAQTIASRVVDVVEDLKFGPKQ